MSIHDTTPARDEWKARMTADHGPGVHFYWTATGYLRAYKPRGIFRGPCLGVFDAHRDRPLNPDFTEVT